MTTFELLQRIQQRLGEQTTFFVDTELVANGLNPAQNLLALARPPLLRQRTTLALTVDLPWYDLRETNRRILRVVRVALGTIVADDLVADSSTGLTGDLTAVSLPTLAATRSDWFTVRGTVENYWTWGHWFGLFPRPISNTTLTIVFDSLPSPLDVAVPDGVPDFAAVYHPLISEIAAGLSLLKESGAEGTRGLQHVAAALGLKMAVDQKAGGA